MQEAPNSLPCERLSARPVAPPPAPRVGPEVRILFFQDWGWGGGRGVGQEGRDALLKVTRDGEGRTALSH